MGRRDIDKIGRATGRWPWGWQTVYGFFTQVWLGPVRLHVFWSADPGNAPHNHPWPYYTFPLVSYVEHVLDTVTGKMYFQVVPRLCVTWRPETHTHRVLGPWDGTITAGVPGVKPGAIVTIALRGRVRHRWSYWRTDVGNKLHAIDWRRYLEHVEKRPKKEAH